MSDVNSVFTNAFASPPAHRVQAPGRLELLGNHTDYNEGLVLSLAVDKYIYIASAPRLDGRIQLVSSSFAQREEFYCDRIEKNSAAPWTNYVKGVLLQLRQRRQRGVHFTGFNAAIHGTIPFGAGMGSSAALEVATALTIRQLFPFKLTAIGIDAPPQRDSKGELPSLDRAEKMLFAKLCQSAESEFVGVNCGLLDQISSLFGKAGHAILIDCRDNIVVHEPMPPSVAVVVCDSGVKHDLSAGEYNQLRSHCEVAAKALGVRSLRSVTPEQIEARKSQLRAREYECAYHVVGEIRRVAFGERALRAGDTEQFGQYLFQSHGSSRDFFKNSCPELDLLVEIARAHPACLGARLTGGGFGGATINLVTESEAKKFMPHVSTQYEQKTGRKMEPWLCRIVDGAS